MARVNIRFETDTAQALRGMRAIERNTGQLTREFSGLRRAAATIGLTALGTRAIQTASQMERLRASTQAVFQSVERGNQVFNELVRVARFPGVTIEGAVRLTNTFENLGVQTQLATGYVTELGNAITLAGGTAVEFARVQRGMRQILSIGRLLQEELFQLTEASDFVGEALERAFGSRIAENIRETLQAAAPGLSSQEQIRQVFVPRLLEGLESLPRAPTDTLNESVRRLNVSFQEFTESFTSLLLPALTEFTNFAGGVLNVITSINEGTSGLLSNTLLLAGAFSVVSTGITIFTNLLRNVGPEINRTEGIIGGLYADLDTALPTDRSAIQNQINLYEEQSRSLQNLQNRQERVRQSLRGIGAALAIGASIAVITTITSRFVEYSDAIEEAEDATRRFFTTSNNLTQQDEFVSSIQRRITELDELNIRYSDLARVSLTGNIDSVNDVRRLLDTINIFQPTEETGSFLSERLPAIRSELQVLESLVRVHTDLSGADFLRQRQTDIVNQQQAIIRVLQQRLDLEELIENTGITIENTGTTIDGVRLFGVSSVALTRDIEQQQAQLQNLADTYDRISESLANLQQQQTNFDLQAQVERIPTDLAIRESILDSLFGELGGAETEAQIRNVSRAIERLNTVIADTELNRLDLEQNRALQIEDPVRRASELASIRLERINFELEANENAARAEEISRQQLERIRDERQQQQVAILQLRSEASRIRAETNQNLANAITSEINAEIQTIQSTIQYNDTIIEQKSTQIERLNRQIESELELQQSLIGFDRILRGGESLQRILDDIDRRAESQRGLAREQFAPDSAELQLELDSIEQQREAARRREIELDRTALNSIAQQRSNATLEEIRRFIQSTNIRTTVYRNAAVAQTEIDIEESRQRQEVLNNELLSESQRQDALTRIRTNAENQRRDIVQLTSQEINRIYRQTADELETTLTRATGNVANSISASFDVILPGIITSIQEARRRVQNEVNILFQPLQSAVSESFAVPIDIVDARQREAREIENIQRTSARRIADIRNDETISVREQTERIQEIWEDAERRRQDLALETERTLSDSFRRITISFARALQQQLIAFAAAEAQKRIIEGAGSILGRERSATENIGGSLISAALISILTSVIGGGFHDPVNDEIARRAGVRTGLRQIARGDGSFGRQSAQDQVSHFQSGFESAVSGQGGSGNVMVDATINLNETEIVKAIVPAVIREQNNGSVPRFSN